MSGYPSYEEIHQLLADPQLALELTAAVDRGDGAELARISRALRQTSTTGDGLCECGCGERTPLALKTLASRGTVRGQPLRFLHGHNRVITDRVAFFWSQVDKNGPVHPVLGTACWPWIGGSRTEWGYGLIRWRNGSGRDKRPLLRAHRVAWELTNGPVPDGLFVCHHCDNPPCCNPAHHFLGTTQDNTADKVAKGRSPSLSGEAHPQAKLTAADVVAIRQLAGDGASPLEIAERFGVARVTIYGIVHRRSWRSVA